MPSRREFLQKTSLASLGLTVPSLVQSENTIGAPAIIAPKTLKSTINMGFIGVGLRGRDHYAEILGRPDVNVVAVCDIDPLAIEECNKIADEKKLKHPKAFLGEHSYKELLQLKGLDAVMIATPWLWHSEMAIEAMKRGIYVGVEVCGGFSLDECWQLVNTHEQTGTHLFFMENVCYRRDIMAVLNMVRKEMFGDLLHLECGYQHDLREVKFNDGKQPYGGGVEFGEKGYSEARWRTLQSVHRNGDLYPTHGIGPVAKMIDINCGNRFLYLTSTSSKAMGLHRYIVNHPKGGASHPNAAVDFKLGDVVTTVLKCNNGESIILSHDTNSPRPYSLGFRVQGTKGIWMDVNRSLYIEGVSKEPHRWEKADSYLKEHDHALWKQFAEKAEGAGHGGMDYFLDNAFVECAKRNERPPVDVYDAATWLAITPLSEQSIATGSMPQPFPDFTRGRWTEWKNTFGRSDAY
jgi:hypothetical protein